MNGQSSVEICSYSPESSEMLLINYQLCKLIKGIVSSISSST